MIAAEACLEGGKSLLIVLQCINVLAAILMSKTKSGHRHHCVEKLMMNLLEQCAPSIAQGVKGDVLAEMLPLPAQISPHPES